MPIEKEPTPAEVVAEINNDVWKWNEALLEEEQIETHDFELTYSTNGVIEHISFLGQLIWDDQDNDIPDDSPTHLLREYLLLQMRDVLNNFTRLAGFCELGRR